MLRLLALVLMTAALTLPCASDSHAAFLVCAPDETLFSASIAIGAPDLQVPTNLFQFDVPNGQQATSGSVTIRGFGDLDGTGGNLERWDVTGETGGVIGSVGATGNFADQCGTLLSSTVAVAAGTLEAWAADGLLTLTGTDAGGNINPAVCGGNADSLELVVEMCLVPLPPRKGCSSP